MIKNRINLEEALRRLKESGLNDSYEIDYTTSDRVEATDAIKLGALGIDVPEDKIYYEDTKGEDEEYQGEWIPIDSDIEDYKRRLTIQLKVNEEIMDWLASSKIDMDALVSELITGFYNSTKASRK